MEDLDEKEEITHVSMIGPEYVWSSEKGTSSLNGLGERVEGREEERSVSFDLKTSTLDSACVFGSTLTVVLGEIRTSTPSALKVKRGRRKKPMLVVEKKKRRGVEIDS